MGRAGGNEGQSWREEEQDGLCVCGPHGGNKIPHCFTLNSEAVPVGSSEPPPPSPPPPSSSVIDFETCATGEDNTAALGQTVRTGRPPVGGLSFHDVPGRCMNPVALKLPQAYETPRPTQPWVSCSGARTTAPDLKHIMGRDGRTRDTVLLSREARVRGKARAVTVSHRHEAAN